MRLLLLLRAEGGAHADPVFDVAVGVRLAHHIAEAVVGCTLERVVVAGLFGRAVDNLLQVGYLLDVDIDRSPRLAVGALVVGERTYHVVGPRIRRGVLVDADMHQVGEALGSGLHCVGVDDAGIGIAVISLTDGRLEGLLQEVVGGVADIGQVVKDGKAGVFTLSLLLSLLFLLFCPISTWFVAVLVILTGSDAETQATRQGSREQKIKILLHSFNCFVVRC